jgi:hypothetical protein
MRLKLKFILELEEDEAVALCKILGKLTDNQKRDMGLNDEEICKMSNIYFSVDQYVNKDNFE